MDKTFAHILALLSALLVWASCSVREDRSPCPCYLTVVLDRAGKQLLWYGMDSLTVSAQGGTDYLRSEPVETERCPDGVEWQTPKEWIRVGAYAGAVTAVRTADALLIPYGAEADSLFAYSARIDCQGETAIDTVVMHKQFATLTLEIKGASEDYPLLLEAESRWAGWDRFSFEPLLGRFRATAIRLREGLYRTRLPRQGDDGFVLHAAGWDGVPLYDFALGKEIAAKGYDWHARDLADIHVTIDYARSTLDIRISDWEDGGSQNYDI